MVLTDGVFKDSTYMCLQAGPLLYFWQRTQNRQKTYLVSVLSSRFAFLYEKEVCLHWRVIPRSGLSDLSPL